MRWRIFYRCCTKWPLSQWAPDALTEQLVAREVLIDLGQKISAEDLQLYYQIGLIGRRDLALAPDARSGFEMVLLRMLAFRPATENARPVTPVARTAAAAVIDKPQTSAPVVTQAAPAATPTVAETPKVSFGGDWQGMIEAINPKGMVRQLAVNCVLQNYSGNEINLLLNQEHKNLLSTGMLNKLQDLLGNWLGEKIKLHITIGAVASETPAQSQQRQVVEKQQSAQQTMAQDPMVQALKENFGAELVPNSLRTID